MDQPMRKQVPTVGQYSKFKDVMPSDWAMSNPGTLLSLSLDARCAPFEVITRGRGYGEAQAVRCSGWLPPAVWGISRGCSFRRPCGGAQAVQCNGFCPTQAPCLRIA